jgi:DNA repair exonuclease SbcCD ATPase subunit
VFKRLSVQGFGNIGSIELNLDNPGLNVVVARNGTGKTTLFSAWFWCITGYTLKPNSKVTPWEPVRGPNYKGTRVKLEFQVGNEMYILVRHANYMGNTFGVKGRNSLRLFRGLKKTEVKYKYKSELQKYIYQLLATSEELLKNTIVFGQKLKRFIEQNSADQKQLLEEAFEISYLRNAKEYLDKQINSLSIEENLSLKNLQALVDKAKLEKQLYLSTKQSYRKELENYHNTKKSLIKDIGDLKAKLQQLPNVKKDIANHYKAIEHTNKLIQRIESKLRLLKDVSDKDFKFSLEIIGNKGTIDSLLADRKVLLKEYKTKTICPSCNRPLDKTSRLAFKAELKKSLEDLKIKLKDLQIKNRALETFRKNVAGKVAKQEKLQAKLASFRSRLTLYSLKIQDLSKSLEASNITFGELKSKEKQLASLLKPKKPSDLLKLKENYKLSKAKSLEAKASLNKIKQKLEEYKWLATVPFSNSGIKAFIFNHMLKEVNRVLESYASIVGFRIEFSIALDKYHKNLECHITKGGVVVNYAELSGGEKQLVDIYTAFATHEVVTLVKNPSNLMILDEIFESLDSSNAEKTMQFILAKATTKTIFLITHNLNFIPTGAKYLRLYKNKLGQARLEV